MHCFHQGSDGSERWSDVLIFATCKRNNQRQMTSLLGYLVQNAEAVESEVGEDGSLVLRVEAVLRGSHYP